MLTKPLQKRENYYLSVIAFTSSIDDNNNITGLNFDRSCCTKYFFFHVGVLWMGTGGVISGAPEVIRFLRSKVSFILSIGQ